MEFKAGEIEGVFIKKLEPHMDNRGYLIETFRLDELLDSFQPEMSYVSYTKSGIARGPHEHQEQTDLFCFVGPGNFWVKLWDNRENSPTYGNYLEIVGGEDHRISVLVPPGVVHGYKNISEKEGMVLNFPDRLYGGWHKKEKVDEIRHEDEEDEFYLDFRKVREGKEGKIDL